MSTAAISNFGENLSFRPAEIIAPLTEEELLRLLKQHRLGRVRVMGSKHSWSPLIETAGVVIDMRNFRHVRIHEEQGQKFATAGAGLQIKHLIAELNQRGLAPPALGLITEQTISGATATGTHGSGRYCLSHYLKAVRIACFDESGENAIIRDIREGDELRAAQCSLGCLGVVVEVTIPVIPQYFVQEQLVPAGSIDHILEMQQSTPLQQFFLIPHSWSLYVQRRKISEHTQRQNGAALYRVYWFLTMDLGMHLAILLTAVWLKMRWAVKFFFQWIVPWTIIPPWKPVDRSDLQLTMEHELFRHLEEEIFIQRRYLKDACLFVREILSLADDASFTLSEPIRNQLRQIGMLDEVTSIAGTWVHHYPICVRRILVDDTLLSMSSVDASGSKEDWYSISLITYLKPRDQFFVVAEFLAKAMSTLFDARTHWGKWCPTSAETIDRLYPLLPTFRKVCRRMDPNGVFRNTMVETKLRLSDGPVVSKSPGELA